MEGSGAVTLVTEIYDGSIGCIDDLCTDDDSTTWANVHPSYKEVIISTGTIASTYVSVYVSNF